MSERKNQDVSIGHSVAQRRHGGSIGLVEDVVSKGNKGRNGSTNYESRYVAIAWIE